MSAFSIKLIAFLALLIDHVGLFFFQDNEILRTIGRISFPLFTWFIANGAYHTHNISLYQKRLILCAVISQIPYLLAYTHEDPTFWSFNAVFTLSLGLAAIQFIKKTKDKRLWILIISVVAILAEIMPADYGAMGVLLVVSCFLFFKNPKLLLLSHIIIFSADLLWDLLLYSSLTNEIVGILALAFIFAYNHKRGPKTGYLFYYFYPLHYALIYLGQLML